MTYTIENKWRKVDNSFVSVLMTAYNREKYIAEAIESVLASTYKNFELIIVDDASEDNTVNIAKKYELIDSRVRIYVNDRNLDQFPNRNKAADYAKGEYLITVDSDDTIYKDSIKNCLDAMAKFPESSFGMYWPHSKVPPFIFSSGEAIKKHFFDKAFLVIGPGGTIMRRDFFEKINRYPVKYGPPGDLYFNLKAACNSPVVLLPFEFVNYRRHENQELNRPYMYLMHNYTYLRDALNELPLPLTKQELKWISKKNKRRFMVNITSYFFSSFNFKKTANAIRETRFTFKDALVGIFQSK